MATKSTKVYYLSRLTTMAQKDANKSLKRLTNTAPFSTQAANTSPFSSGTNVKSFSELPGPKGLPFIGTMFDFPRDPSKVTPFLRQRCDKYFPIYKESGGGITTVMVYDFDAIEKIFRNEAKYPRRFPFELWKEYRRTSGQSHGVLTSEGEEWWLMRREVNKPMLRVKDVASYADDVNEVTTGFLDRLASIRGHDGLVPGFDNELFNWSLESIGKILYEKRLGALSEEKEPELQEFINAVHTMLATSGYLFALPTWVCKTFLRKHYSAHMRSWDTLFRVAKKCSDERMKVLASHAPDAEDETNGVLSYLLRQQSLSTQEVYANITELMTAGVDTTATGIQWFCQEVALRPDVQDRIAAEVKAVVPDSQVPSYRDLQNLPYLKAAVKEVYRMYPPGTGLSRIIAEDIELCGYHIPANTMVLIFNSVLNRLPQYFEDPDEFRPERWLRENKDNVHPFSQLHFGHGTRMCVGRRVAELETHILLSRLIRRFILEPAFAERSVGSFEVVYKPNPPIRIKLRDRS